MSPTYEDYEQVRREPPADSTPLYHLRENGPVSIKSVSIKSDKDNTEDDTFPIVGIGASAGGLEALESFFKHLPEDCNMAFVVIQHLDPTQKGIMPELIQRFTSMEVVPVKDRLKVYPNCI